jgi:hypothetical protein
VSCQVAEDFPELSMYRQARATKSARLCAMAIASGDRGPRVRRRSLLDGCLAKPAHCEGDSQCFRTRVQEECIHAQLFWGLAIPVVCVPPNLVLHASSAGKSVGGKHEGKILER